MKRSHRVAILGIMSLLVLLVVFSGGFWGASVEHKVVIDNHDDSDHAVSVQIAKNGELVRARETVEPGATWNVTTLSAKGDYKITVTVADERMAREAFSLPLETDGTSYSSFTIQENGGIESSTYWQD
ncbi:hypothetical protein [Haladaptatus sp. ZSTT2]|uniref:hypothetical protein n=1 Tax=Haladaptatus sp. ZSTT2 TaxID=3120515 RepID=UPI00300E95B0